MADTLMGMDEVAKELQLGKDQIVELVKKGMLRGFMDQKTYKFRAADVDAYKKKLSSSATRLAESKKDSKITDGPGGKKEATSKISLAEIESDSGVEESDQTSVLAPADEAEDHLTVKPEETPVFKFSEKELGLEDEEGSGVEEADQTSLMMPAEEAKEEAKSQEPAFDFDTQGLAIDADAKPPVVADESESSVDILDVADESSSESSSSAMDLSEESGTGSEVVAVTEIEESPKPMKPVRAEPAPRGVSSGKDSSATTVSDLLGKAEEGSDEELETLDIDEVVETGEVPLAQAGKPAADGRDTTPIAGEAETVDIGETAAGVEESAFQVGEGVETAGVSDAVAEALKEAAGPEEEIEEAEAEEAPAGGRVVVPTGWEVVAPSKLFNGCMIAASVLMFLGGAFFICETYNIATGVTQPVVDALKGLSFP